MTGDKNYFIDTNLTYDSKVKLGNRDYVEVEDKGSIGVATKQGCMVIHDTLYVPKLDKKLLSTGELLKHGYSLQFENQECKFFIQKEELLLL